MKKMFISPSARHPWKGALLLFYKGGSFKLLSLSVFSSFSDIMAAILPISASFSQMPILLQRVRDLLSLPKWTRQQAESFLLSHPLPPTKSYLIYPVDNEYAVLACFQIIVGRLGVPSINLDYIGIDPMNGRFARLRWTDGRPLYIDPHWDDQSEICEFFGPDIISLEMCQKQIARRTELLNLGMAADPVSVERAKASLTAAAPGVYFVKPDPTSETAQFKIYVKGAAGALHKISISITTEGAWMLWKNQKPVQSFAHFSEMAKFLELGCPLNRWENMARMKAESQRSIQIAGLPRPTPVRGKVPAETLCKIDKRQVVGPPERAESLFLNPFTLPYDRDFFQRAVADGALSDLSKEEG
jgi:hypothetical protein